MAEGAERHACLIHTYVLMTNHVHLLVTPSHKASVSQFMQYIGRRYVPYINKKYGRSGTLWEGRFRASNIDSSAYLLACYRYIELNPVRAAMVGNPGDYPWSGHRFNAWGTENPLLTPHAEYSALGNTPKARRAAYRRVFEHEPPSAEIDAIRGHVNSGKPLGSARFVATIESQLAVSVGNAGPGRPPRRGGRKGI